MSTLTSEKQARLHEECSEAIVRRNWTNVTDWVENGPLREQVLWRKTFGQGFFLRGQQYEATPVPPTPDVSLIGFVKSSAALDCDFGHGRFSGTSLKSGFLLTPAHLLSTVSGRGHDDIDYLVLSQRQNEIDHLAALAGLKTPDLGSLHARVIRDSVLERMMALLVEQVQQGETASSLAADGLRMSITGRLFNLAGTPPPAPRTRRPKLGPAQMANVLHLMHARLEVGVSIDELAQAAGVSPLRFGKLFKEATGDRPHTYLNRLRVEKAKQLLRDRPEWSGAAIADACGFADQSHLGRHFKKLVGTTPAAWRNSA